MAREDAKPQNTPRVQISVILTHIEQRGALLFSKGSARFEAEVTEAKRLKEQLMGSVLTLASGEIGPF